ncbi:hypothetical protein COTS27_01502 [Spirochaetota bacterium]|nr:hypothetical protein COTS27_01502 [Spirochaetota bacterium]
MSFVESSYIYYLQHINNIPLLSHSEEKKIAQKIRQGDEAAKQKLIKANLRFVVKIAKRYTNKGVSLIDLISEGNLGLIRATETFDPDRGYHFISYAVHWIKQSIIKCIAEKSRPVRMPLSWNNNLIKISRYFNDLNQTDLSDKKLNKLAKELGIKNKELLKLIQFSQNSLSLDQVIYSNNSTHEETLLIKSTLENENSTSPEESFIKKHFKNHLYSVIEELKPIEQDILKRRFGLGEYSFPQTLLTIGAKYNLTKERVRQIEKRAVARLRQKLSKEDVAEYTL